MRNAEMHPGDLTLTENGRFDGMVQGNLTVAARVRALVAGMVQGNLVVEPGAQVELNGMIGGDLINRGGKVSGTGMIAGRHRPGGAP